MRLERLDLRHIALAVTAPLIVVMGLSIWAERNAAPGFLPHGVCFTWMPSLVWLHVVSDLLIGFAYMTIPLALYHFVRRRKDLPFHWIFMLFALFIVSCGATHFLGVWNIWYPDYWLSGAVKALTAAVSVPTGIALIALIPQALAIPTVGQLRSAKEALEQEVETRRAVEAELRRATADLEDRVAERTRELEEANALLDTLFDRAPVGLGLWDRDTRFLRINEELALMDGLSREAHLGRPIAEVLPGMSDRVPDLIRNVADTGVALIRREVGGHTPASMRSRCWQLSFYPVRMADGRVAVGGVIEEITEKKDAERERTRLLEQAQAARAEAEEANRRKDEFLAKVSHELRTPLQAMLGWAQMLRSGRLPPAEVGRAVDRLDRNVRAQARLIDDLLDYSRILSGKLRLETQDLDPAGPIAAAVEVVRPQAALREVTLDARIDTGSRPMRLDPERIQQVLWNLLSNAVKFSPQGGRVELRAQRQPGGLRITVRDQGRGIDPAFLPHVFEPFAQDRQQGGTQGLGLGLSIVHNIVELHGGRVHVESAGPGQGATFVVELHDDGPGRPRDRTPVTAGKAASTPPAGQPGTTTSPGHETRAPTPSGGPLAGRRLLLVEDSEDSADAMALGLALHGADITQAATLDEAVSLLREASFDALVSDLGLAGRDGRDIVRILRAGGTAAPRDLPALAVSAYGTDKDKRASREAGFDAHLAKPVDADTVAAALAPLLAARR